jgi:hypothetical protein
MTWSSRMTIAMSSRPLAFPLPKQMLVSFVPWLPAPISAMEMARTCDSCVKTGDARRPSAHYSKCKKPIVGVSVTPKDTRFVVTSLFMT